jgi:hypothetical protein
VRGELCGSRLDAKEPKMAGTHSHGVLLGTAHKKNSPETHVLGVCFPETAARHRQCQKTCLSAPDEMSSSLEFEVSKYCKKLNFGAMSTGNLPQPRPSVPCPFACFVKYIRIQICNAHRILPCFFGISQFRTRVELPYVLSFLLLLKQHGHQYMCKPCFKTAA